ncbi:hypothetical protein BC351_31945 [Paenibacillus ferrarius]|uniref:Glycosyltransferase 2-like domain-containing protein n=1 Tax=Paenibacillus ferrarius TaxID=1469647 RepID=A0A1V4HFI1_9BACL|nr:glycosyltransferase family A protein [Paenibacillus ferrarius]OPH53093.1 hypothetical protein BC351_31945 [Paenibacillus ferrarius]
MNFWKNKNVHFDYLKLTAKVYLLKRATWLRRIYTKNMYMNPSFTILIPTFNHGYLLKYALDSILLQTNQNFEVFIICDGAVIEGRKTAWRYAFSDPRFNVVDRPKGDRHGEAYRHEALLSAKGKFVCYLGDDDLWFPDHLHQIEQALATCDFVHSRHTGVNDQNQVFSHYDSIENVEIRQRMLNQKFNIFGPTVVGHRMETYRRLQEGWAPGPSDIWSDLNMWRKFIRLEEINFATIPAVTALFLPSPFRLKMTLKEREEEMAMWAEKIRSSTFRNSLQ